MTVRGVAVTAFERMYMRKLSKVFVGLGLLALVAAAVAYGANGKKSASDTLVFASSADPVALDGALISDGESAASIIQIYEGLVALKPGTTTVVPSLATNWKASTNGKQWTFTLRQGVKFSDGTPFNAAAVCYNFNRWYNFTGPLQNPSATYYWNTVFGGFKTVRPEPGRTEGQSLQELQGHGQPRRHDQPDAPSSSFLGALALTSFGIASPTAHEEVRRQRGHGRRGGRLPSDRHVRDAASDGHRPVHAPVVDGRRQARARPQPELLGHEGESQPAHLPADRRQRGAAPGAAER